MSQLLGRQDCIKSLRKDLVDIQGAILDVFSRTGPVHFTSWKFPDKFSCNLDMVTLLEEYDFVDGEDVFNQHSHIVLLELVIDRLVLLLQCVSVYAEQQRGRHRREPSQQKGCLSVGLVVRNYWCNLLQFTNKKETNQEKMKTPVYNATKTESGISSISSSATNFNKRCTSAWSSTSSFNLLPQNNAPSSLTHTTPCYSKAEQRNVSCQTTKSSLIPCDACHQVQSLLRTTGAALIDLFQTEGLPSSLQPLSAAMEDAVDVGHMTAGDVTQWANEQLRDMRRLAKHLQDVRGTVQPLKEKLQVAEADRDSFRSQLDRAQKEFKQKLEKHQTNVVRLEFSLQKAQRSSKENEQRLQDEQQQLKKENLALEERINQLMEKVALQQEALQEFETEKTELQNKVKNLQTEKETSCRCVQQLQAQLSDAQLLLDKEKAKYTSACRQQESMQAKQKSLVGRVSFLDEECEELQRQLAEKEEAQMSLDSRLQQMSEVNEQQQAQLIQQQNLCKKLQQEKQTTETRADELKKRVSELMERVQALRERERLLVAFPELSNWTLAQPQSTGNVILDMEQQLQANSIRIKVLEQENTTLHKSLGKLRQRAKSDAPREVSPQKT